ncbi:MAG: alpha-amylase family glycosyl hydrolase [Flavisolibacter sp.]
MKRLLLSCTVMITVMVARAQLLAWTPAFPVQKDSSQTLVITMDASKGNRGLYNYTPTTDVYVHTGVITNFSTSPTDWKHVKFNQNFNQPNPALQASYIGNNQWQFTIAGSLRDYYGLTDPTETIQKIAILFRTGNGSRKQANSDNTDMYLPVYGDSLAVRISQPLSQPKYTVIAEPQSWTLGTSFLVSAQANRASTLKLYHNGSLVTAATGATTVTGSSQVTAAGNQQVVAVADDGTAARYDTLNVFVSGGTSTVADLPAGVRDGINYETGDTSVTLVLRAPGKNTVSVIGEFNNWTPQTMNRTPDGRFFWLRIHPLVPGQEYAYQYLVDNQLKIADPYTEKVLDPSNDPGIPTATYPALKPYPSGQTGILSVLQTASPAYAWQVPSFNRPDKRGLVIYELLVRDFVAAHNWKTVSDSLNYLKKLGVNAIELMPFNEFEGNDSWGYNPDFYFAPDKYYGTKNALKAFIDSCHSKGMAVIMDIALNHSFGSSPMVQLYWDAANNRPAPDNPWFNPVAKHAYNVGYDMNHESADTKYFVSRVTGHWLQQYKIDGFRFDLAKGFTQKQTCDGTGGNCDVNAWGAYDTSRVVIWKRYYDTVAAQSGNGYVILEHFADNSEEKDLAAYGMLLWGNMSYNYGEASMGWPGNWDFSNGIYTVRNWSKPHLVSYMESHDEERIVYKNLNYGNGASGYNIRDTATALKRMGLSAAFLLTIPGPKMIWQFGELGYSYSINTCTDSTVNNNCRLSAKPIRWDYLNDPRRKSLFQTYSQLIHLRFHPWYREAFLSGSISQSLAGPVKWIRVSSGDSSQLLVVGNFDVTTQPASLTFPSSGTWYDYLDSTSFAATGTAQSISLQPGEFHVYVNRNVDGLMATPVVEIPWNAEKLEARVYPNPARSALTLEWQMPQTGTVAIDLYGPLGQFIRTLDQGLFSQGTHRATIGKLALSSGMYFVQLRTKSATKTLLVNIQE